LIFGLSRKILCAGETLNVLDKEGGRPMDLITVNRPARRQGIQLGFTVVELLISLAVVGILVALLVMGVQASRQAGHRTECVSHLHQIGLAVASYESTHRVFPPAIAHIGSLHYAILPYIEQQELYDRLLVWFDNRNTSPYPEAPTIPLYLCPDDSAVVFGDGNAGTNYAGNSGTWWPDTGWDGLFVYWNPIAKDDIVGPIGSASVTDGLSNTFAMNEILRSNGSWDRMRVAWKLPKSIQDIDAFANHCWSIPPEPKQYGWNGLNYGRGMPWTDGNLRVTLYNHVLTPNQPTCWRSIFSAAYTASSSHPGGVNSLFADGHVQFYSDSVHVKVWRALGSRAGGDR
jgi:prepilin-type processing-associated H-X9-DG protein/prepilin-type N-terminal cleavage/methylation domain-containing protein